MRDTSTSSSSSSSSSSTLYAAGVTAARQRRCDVERRARHFSFPSQSHRDERSSAPRAGETLGCLSNAPGQRSNYALADFSRTSGTVFSILVSFFDGIVSRIQIGRESSKRGGSGDSDSTAIQIIPRALAAVRPLASRNASAIEPGVLPIFPKWFVERKARWKILREDDRER